MRFGIVFSRCLTTQGRPREQRTERRPAVRQRQHVDYQCRPTRRWIACPDSTTRTNSRSVRAPAHQYELVLGDRMRAAVDLSRDSQRPVDAAADTDPLGRWYRLLAEGLFGSILLTVITALMTSSVETIAIGSWFLLWLFVAAAQTLSWRRRLRSSLSAGTPTMSRTDRFLVTWYESFIFGIGVAVLICWALWRGHKLPWLT